MTNDQINAKINRNRDEIEKWLNGDYPLDLVYARIRILTQQNERLIEKMKS